jgi:3-dehydroquinate synthase
MILRNKGRAVDGFFLSAVELVGEDGLLNLENSSTLRLFAISRDPLIDNIAPHLNAITSTRDREVLLTLAHRVRFTRGALDVANPALREIFASDTGIVKRRAIVFIDEGVDHTSNGTLIAKITQYFAAHAAHMPRLVDLVVVPGGEAAKHDMRVVDRVVELVEHHRICRKSFVIAIGGGAMLDAVGFGAAIAHRGVRLVRLPTTVLAQDDAAMGVKNGINRFGKKNFVGSFAVPFAVLCDEEFLATLPDAVYRAGFSEAVKIALLKDPALFTQIERDALLIAARDPNAARAVIHRSAELHLAHIIENGDPFETTEARPLDFGHWSAHRLESLSNHAISHGDAVALGLLLDCRYANLKGWLSNELHARIHACITRLGLPTRHALFANHAALTAGLEEFREHLGGTLTITMLRAVGEGFEVHDIDAALMRQAAAEMV